jgi:branched-chain amino acid transport system permease protein
MKPSRQIIAILLIFLALVLFPLLGLKFHTYLLIECFIYSALAISYYMLLGHTGLMSFGHAALFGIGAYVSAITLVSYSHLPVALTVLFGGVSGLVCGLLFGLIVIRLSGMYLAFGTLALGQMIWAIAWKWRAVTGGDDGLTGWSAREVALPFLGQFTLTNISFLYYFVLFFAGLCIMFCLYLIRTAFGEALSSIRSNRNRADFVGVNVNHARLIVFAFSGLTAGISGALFILFKKAAAPSFLDMTMSFNILIMSVIGGYSAFLGPIVGSFIYVYMMEYLSSFTERWQLLMGVFFVLLIVFYPKGAVGIAHQIARKVSFMRKKNGVRSRC